MSSDQYLDVGEWSVSSLRVKGSMAKKSSIYTAVATTVTSTLKGEQIRLGTVTVDPVGDKQFTVEAASTLIKSFPRPYYKGMTMDFDLINRSDAADTSEVITVVAGTGGTAVGHMELRSAQSDTSIVSSGSAIFKIEFTDVASGSEAYNVIRRA